MLVGCIIETFSDMGTKSYSIFLERKNDAFYLVIGYILCKNI